MNLVKEGPLLLPRFTIVPFTKVVDPPLARRLVGRVFLAEGPQGINLFCRSFINIPFSEVEDPPVLLAEGL